MIHEATAVPAADKTRADEFAGTPGRLTFCVWTGEVFIFSLMIHQDFATVPVASTDQRTAFAPQPGPRMAMEKDEGTIRAPGMWTMRPLFSLTAGWRNLTSKNGVPQNVKRENRHGGNGCADGSDFAT